ncbi:MAG: NAD(P)-dependent oxidoreductase [Coriobacteriia bacterium]|nr:NAD(P)-dependent oxidoreductase [Coriobacteriia bacterium]
MIAPDATIGFVGTGVMGRSMAGHLMDAGYRLRVNNRTRLKAEPLLERGAVWCETVADVAEGASAVITMVGYPVDVEQVYLGSGGLVECAAPGTVLIDMTTSSPVLATRVHAAAASAGVRAVDAPVSGGDVGARDARLTIMVGGDADAFAHVEPLLRVMGPNVVLQGGPGAGQHTKMSNQLAIAGCMLGVCEALAYAEGAGLDPALVLSSIGAGSAGSWSLANYAPRMLSGDFAPGFYVKHFIKDMRIALDSARELGIDLPGLEVLLALYERLAERGGAEKGTQALYLLYKEHAAGL